MSIHTLHGIAAISDIRKQSTRNYVSYESLYEFLGGRTVPYAHLTECCAENDFLTVDDSTRAGAEACLLARKLGHEVTLFVNPWQVISQEPYFFSLIDTFIDDRNTDVVKYMNDHFNLSEQADVTRFRKRVKVNLMALAADEAVKASYTVGNHLRAPVNPLPHHLHPLQVDDIRVLIDEGVVIESHGWAHQDIGSLSGSELITDMANTDAWLCDTFGLVSKHYAVPFGFPDLPKQIRDNLPKQYFLVRCDLPSGRLLTNCWNRTDITSLVRCRNL